MRTRSVLSFVFYLSAAFVLWVVAASIFSPVFSLQLARDQTAAFAGIMVTWMWSNGNDGYCQVSWFEKYDEKRLNRMSLSPLLLLSSLR